MTCEHAIIKFSLPPLPLSLSSAGFVEGNQGNSFIHIWNSGFFILVSAYYEWMCHCIFWFSDCSSCYQLDIGVAIGIITCDIILTLLIALSVYCFISHQKRRGSLHTHARCCCSGMPACKRNQKLHMLLLHVLQSKWHNIFLMFKVKQKLTIPLWGQRRLKWNHLIR